MSSPSPRTGWQSLVGLDLLSPADRARAQAQSRCTQTPHCPLAPGYESGDTKQPSQHKVFAILLGEIWQCLYKTFAVTTDTFVHAALTSCIWLFQAKMKVLFLTVKIQLFPKVAEQLLTSPPEMTALLHLLATAYVFKMRSWVFLFIYFSVDDASFQKTEKNPTQQVN